MRSRWTATSGRFTSEKFQEDKVGGQAADAFSDPDRRDHQDFGRAARLAGADQAAILAAALTVTVVIGMVFLIVRQFRRQHAAAQRKLWEKSQHLDTAINNMTQGLLLFDSPAAS